MSQEIIHGDCLNEMRMFSDNHFSGIVTDPPYGLQFMGKQWDQQVPGKEYWREMLRICKPGSFLLAFGGTRTYHRLACAIEDAGWEIRDCLQWVYGSGFPKSHNHFGIEGFGTALKPAYEPIIMAMKPIDGTFAENAEKWGQAGINIDECRIGNHEYSQEEWSKKGLSRVTGNSFGEHKGSDSVVPKGRWPSNVIFDEEAGKILDEQSGTSLSVSTPRKRQVMTSKGINGGSFGNPDKINNGHNGFSYGFTDSGGASRFFYCAKASSSERNEGLEGMPDYSCYNESNPQPNRDLRAQKLIKNNHPTVKPLKLMEYLLKLISPPKDAIILDPFAGSGTTLLAAKNLGISCIGIEKEEAYCEIIRGRLNVKQLDFMEKMA